jgi:hypothetical protein
VRPIVIIITVLAPSLVAMPRSSSDYSLAPEIADGGGLRGTSASYTASFSTGPGGVGTSADYTAQGGFAGQLGDPGPILPTLYQQWMFDNALTGNDALPGEDPDGDGLNNLQEYAFGMNPKVSYAGSVRWSGTVLLEPGVPVPFASGTEGSFTFRAVFVRRKDHVAAGLAYTVEFSGDLSTWRASTSTPLVLAEDEQVQSVAVPYPFFVNGKKATYFRVRVQSN